MGERDGAGASGSDGTITDDLNAAWAELERSGSGGSENDGSGNQGTAAGTGAAPASVAVDTGEKTSEKENTTDDGRLRNPDGTFAAKPPEQADQKAATDGTKPAADQKAPAATPQPGSEQVEKIPTGWNVAADDWAKTPASVRSKVLEREAQVSQGFRQINETIAPLAELSKARSIPWQEGLGRLVHAQQRLDSNPAEAIIWIAKSYGLNLDDVAEIAAGNMPMPAPKGQTPQTVQNGQAIPPEVDQRIQRLESRLRAEDEGTTLTEIDTFAKQPGREAFDDVIPQINMVLPGIRAANPQLVATRDGRLKILEMAYSAAVGMSPQAQAKIRDLQAKKAEGERTKAKASQAANLHLGGAPARPANGGASTGDVYADLAAAWDQLAN